MQDHADADALYFQNSALYPIHYEFVSTHLSGDPLPVVPHWPSSTPPSITAPSGASPSAR
ncbi:hypothetical protein [Nannocystis pusilla]|uniref:hypothetical protein n=1 Tax=Nannocystis pusilla TaxID=889268 RepID=UPI003B7DA8D6